MQLLVPKKVVNTISMPTRESIFFSQEQYGEENDNKYCRPVSGTFEGVDAIIPPLQYTVKKERNIPITAIEKIHEIFKTKLNGKKMLFYYIVTPDVFSSFKLHHPKLSQAYVTKYFEYHVLTPFVLISK